MATDNNNPFILPGLGQTGDLAQNPIFASMEMMRQAWQGLAGAGGVGAGPLTPPLSTEELDRRISDLRAVENWLRMNLSMLTSTIQGLEVQSATLATLKSFMPAAANAAAASQDGPSPLEVALGIRRPDQNAAPAAEPRADSAASPDASGTAGAASATVQPEAGQDAGPGDPGTDPGAYAAQATAAAQGWWDMLQKQFDTLAAATAATLEGAQAAAQAAGQEAQATAAPGKAAKTSTTRRAAPPRKTAAKTAARKTAKTAAATSSKTAASAKRGGARKTGVTRGRSGTGGSKTST